MIKCYNDLEIDKKVQTIEIEEELRRANEVQECLEKGQIHSCGICDECLIHCLGGRYE